MHQVTALRVPPAVGPTVRVVRQARVLIEDVVDALEEDRMGIIHPADGWSHVIPGIAGVGDHALPGLVPFGSGLPLDLLTRRQVARAGLVDRFTTAGEKLDLGSGQGPLPERGVIDQAVEPIRPARVCANHEARLCGCGYLPSSRLLISRDSVHEQRQLGTVVADHQVMPVGHGQAFQRGSDLPEVLFSAEIELKPELHPAPQVPGEQVVVLGFAFLGEQARRPSAGRVPQPKADGQGWPSQVERLSRVFPSDEPATVELGYPAIAASP